MSAHDVLRTWPLPLLGVLLLAAGVQAYRGRWTSWVSTFPGRRYTGPAAAWFGGTCIASFLALLALSQPGPVAGVLGGLLALASGLCFVVFVLSPFWMWAPLQPRWWRAWSASGGPRSPRVRRSR